MSLAVGNRIGNYRIVRQLRDERLGPGAQLAVFLLLHEHTRHEAELRAPTPAQPAELLAPSLARFFQVARGLALVRDPGLIEVLDVDQLPSGQPYVISERPPSGELLCARIARFGRLPEVQAIFIATNLPVTQAMGLPMDLFPVLFAIGRAPGWLAQWEEMLNDPEQKIARPRQVYLGASRRDYVPMKDR